MVTLRRNKKPFWVRHIDKADDMTVYTEPEPMRMNLFPTNADSDLIALGKEYAEYMRARVNIEEAKKYSVGDLIYTDIPLFSDIMDVGNAMYQINAILPVLNIAEIRCVRLSGA